MGGDLRLDPNGPGARFVLHLPAAVQSAIPA
jgi:signal transduction histidine kinase